MGWDSETTVEIVLAGLGVLTAVIIAAIGGLYSCWRRRVENRNRIREATFESSEAIEALTYSFNMFCLNSTDHADERSKTVPSAEALKAWACQWASNKYSTGKKRKAFLATETQRRKMKALFVEMAGHVFDGKGKTFPNDFRAAKFFLFVLPLERANAEVVMNEPWGEWMIQGEFRSLIADKKSGRTLRAVARASRGQKREFLSKCWASVRDVVWGEEPWVSKSNYSYVSSSSASASPSESPSSSSSS